MPPNPGRDVFIVDGSRTPFLKARGGPGPFTPVDLAVWAGRPLLLRQPFAPADLDDVILGCVNPHYDEVNPGRVAALRLGCGDGTPGWTVQRNCGSGMQSIDTARINIAHGHADLVLAGGTEALSHTPVLHTSEFVTWLGQWNRARTVADKVRTLGRLRPSFLTPIISLLRGLTDPICGLNMGQTAEVLAYRFGISREAADAYALQSHERLAAAHAAGHLNEIEPIIDDDGNVYDHDDGVRPGNTMEALARLQPAFEAPFGKVTAGNSSQITDGACWVLLASETAVERHQLTPLARIVDGTWSALNPQVMGLGPVFAVTPLLARHGIQRDDVAAWELNEAFAAQVLACLAAWESDEFCRTYLNLESAFGPLSKERLNVDGGAVSLGHPVGTSGARIVLHVTNVLARLGKRYGVATECIGGGQAGAMVIEALS